MTQKALILMSLLLIKHFLCDFPFQSQKMIKHKGNYGHPAGITHSLIHSQATFMVFLFFSPVSTLLAAIDFITHYHIDWFKMKFGCQDQSTKRFWTHLGLDQLLHGLNYIGLVAIALSFQ